MHKKTAEFKIRVHEFLQVSSSRSRMRKAKTVFRGRRRLTGHGERDFLKVHG